MISGLRSISVYSVGRKKLKRLLLLLPLLEWLGTVHSMAKGKIVHVEVEVSFLKSTSRTVECYLLILALCGNRQATRLCLRQLSKVGSYFLLKNSSKAITLLMPQITAKGVGQKQRSIHLMD